MMPRLLLTVGVSAATRARMQFLSRNFCVKMLAIAACLAAGGCASQGVTLPPLPAWQQPAGNAHIPGVYVANQTRAHVPGVPVSYSDATYTIVSREWLDAFIAWTWHAAKAAGVEYTAQSFDCENFAGLFSELASLAAAKAGVRASPLIARVVVGDDGEGRHELVGVVTDRGVFIVEPQPDAGPFRIWALDAYPRQILSVTFGSLNP
jgi:hypothetical protein